MRRRIERGEHRLDLAVLPRDTTLQRRELLLHFVEERAGRRDDGVVVWRFLDRRTVVHPHPTRRTVRCASRVGADSVLGVEFNRGFPEFLRTEAAIFAELGEGLLRLGPIRHLELLPDSTSLATLLAMPALRHLISLHLENSKLGDADAAAIAACPHLVRLASLGLRQNRIGESGVEALAVSARTRRLVMIDLRSNPHNTANIALDEGIYDERGRLEFVRPSSARRWRRSTVPSHGCTRSRRSAPIAITSPRSRGGERHRRELDDAARA